MRLSERAVCEGPGTDPWQTSPCCVSNLPAGKKRIFRSAINPLTAMNDQYRISPRNVNSISSRQVIRIKKNKVASFAKGCKMDAKRS